MNDTLIGRERLTAKGRAMRERIVAAAAELVFKSGARETSLDDVRQQVGASKSQLYHYFADKDELLRAVIEFQASRVIEGQQPELAAIKSWESLLAWRNKLVWLADAYGKIGGCPMGSLANELAHYRQSHRTALAAGFQQWAEEIERALLALQASGALSANFDLKSLSMLFLSTIQGGLLFAKLNGSGEALAKRPRFADCADPESGIPYSRARTGVSKGVRRHGAALATAQTRLRIHARRTRSY